MPASSMEKIVSLSKRRGFLFQSSEVYGGLGSTWDYGPLGVELKNNVKRVWWKSVVYQRDDMEGLDAAILMNRMVWKYSGHETTFSDPLVDCRDCKTRSRADHLKEGKCPKCGSKQLTDPRQFNLMFKTYVGPLEGDENLAYLRPETAQGIFTNFLNVLQTSRRKLPFGIAQIGKAFRNEITPGNFTFRTREFEQMEIEYFCKPPEYLGPFEKTDVELHQEWVESRYQFYLQLGIDASRLRKRVQTKEELAHYAKATTDLEYQFPGSLGFSELEGIANRQDYDLSAHSRDIPSEDMNRLKLLGNPESTQKLEYFDDQYVDPVTQKKGARYIPYVIEPSAGADRATLAFLCEAYEEELLTQPSKDELAVLCEAMQAASKNIDKRIVDAEKEEKKGSSTQGMTLKDLLVIQSEIARVQQGLPHTLMQVSDLCDLKGADKLDLVKKIRPLAARLCDDHTRVVLRLHPELSPIKVAVFPLKKNEPALVELAKSVKHLVSKSMRAVYDDTAAIGKLYRRQDEIGTPFCITIDYESLKEQTVTVRERDSMQQHRLKIAELLPWLQQKLSM